MSQDLVIVVSDKDIEQSMVGLLGRPEALGTRPVEYRLLVHPQRDPGCYQTGDQLVAPYADTWQHALIVFDRAWEGAPSHDAGALAHHVEEKLRPAWGDRGRCLVIDPEVESWIWSDSPHVVTILGWEGRVPDLRTWLDQEGLWPVGQAKPTDPKVTFERAMAVVKLPPAAGIFRNLAEKVTLQRCSDPSFRALVNVLRSWFAP
jgi:hypothetical protein